EQPTVTESVSSVATPLPKVSPTTVADIANAAATVVLRTVQVTAVVRVGPDVNAPPAGANADRGQAPGNPLTAADVTARILVPNTVLTPRFTTSTGRVEGTGADQPVFPWEEEFGPEQNGAAVPSTSSGDEKAPESADRQAAQIE